jgi:hypothetical protein
MNEDEDLVLNAKAIGLAIGGAALAGMLFVLTRRDQKSDSQAETVTSEADAFAETAREAAREARSRREAAEEAVKEHLESLKDTVASDSTATERDLKAAAWDAQERARLAESKLRAASSRVAGDASHIASRVGEEARHLAGEGKERLSHLRRPGGPDAEVERLKTELETLRKELAGKAKSEGKDVLGVKKKLAGKKVGPLPEGVAGEAASAALQNLEKSLKTKAPLLLAARNKAQAMEILQREFGPVLRDSALLALTTALSSAERASQKAASAQQEFKERLSEAARPEVSETLGVAADKLRAAQDAATAEALRARDEAEADARAARAELERLKAELAAKLEEMKHAADANGAQSVWNRQEPEPSVIEGPADLLEEEGDSEDKEKAESNGKRGIPGLLWGGAGLGLAIYAMMDPERRESILRLANEATVQMQELMRDLQGYDDEF